jgi:hypothetical protein
MNTFYSSIAWELAAVDNLRHLQKLWRLNTDSRLLKGWLLLHKLLLRHDLNTLSELHLWILMKLRSKGWSLIGHLSIYELILIIKLTLLVRNQVLRWQVRLWEQLSNWRVVLRLKLLILVVNWVKLTRL